MPCPRLRRALALVAVCTALSLATACEPCECDALTLSAGDSVVIEPAAAGGTATRLVVDSVVIEPAAARRTLRVFPQ